MCMNQNNGVVKLFKECFKRTESVTYTFTENPACKYYGHCSKCPYLKYPFCTYPDEDEMV